MPDRTLVDTDSAQTLTNKTLTAPVIGTISNTGDLALPMSTDTLVGRATTDTLTNKTLIGPAITSAVLTTSTVAEAPTVDLGIANKSYVDQRGITLAAPQATTSGTSKDFTSIPSGVRRVTIMLSEVSNDGASYMLVQLGDSGGIESTGYISTVVGVVMNSAASSVSETDSSTSGILIAKRESGAENTDVISGMITLTLIDSSTNSWVWSGTMKLRTDTVTYFAGSKSLSSTLDRVRLTSVSGTATFDAGTVNILYER